MHVTRTLVAHVATAVRRRTCDSAGGALSSSGAAAVARRSFSAAPAAAPAAPAAAAATARACPVSAVAASAAPASSAAGAAPTASSCSRSRPAPAAPSRPVSVDEFLARIRRAQAGAPAAAPAPASPAILTDRFGRLHNYLRISLTERCNLRCVYCMPEEGVDLTPAASLLSAAEVQRALTLFVQAGVTKLRLTGGEPTVRKDLAQIISAAASLRPQGLDAICLTTNGLVLARKLPALEAAGLTHVNISLDTLDAALFESMTRRPGHHLVRRAIDDAVAAVKATKLRAEQARAEGRPAPVIGLRSVKINCVIMKGTNEQEILDFVEMTRLNDLEVRFIEYMPFDGNRWSDSKFLSYADMLTLIRTRYPTIGRAVVEANETAKTYAVPGFAGRVGFISSMSDHFCSTCNRLRITADGNLKVCLFGAQEVSLRDAIRQGKSDDELAAIIGAAVQKKKAQHAGMTQLAQQKNRPMITIGG